MSNLFSKEELEYVMQHYVNSKINMEGMQRTTAEVKKFEVRDSDIFLLGYPKSGTTWAQEMVWLILHDLDFEGAKVYIDERFPNLEVCGFNYATANSNVNVLKCHSDSITFATNMANPRTIKSHFPVDNLPEQLLNGEKKAKIIYVARNPKDVCVSSFYHNKNLYKTFTGSLEDFCKLFMSDLAGTWDYWKNVLYFWNRRNEDHILFIKYEEMKNNLSEVIQRVTKFLDKPLTKEREMQLMNWLHFDSMKNNSAVNHENLYDRSGFMRVGKIGEHKKEMSPEMILKLDDWIKEALKNSDYEI